MHSKYIVRGIAVYASGLYCYLLKKDWDKLKMIDEVKVTNEVNNEISKR